MELGDVWRKLSHGWHCSQPRGAHGCNRHPGVELRVRPKEPVLSSRLISSLRRKDNSDLLRMASEVNTFCRPEFDGPEFDGPEFDVKRVTSLSEQGATEPRRLTADQYHIEKSAARSVPSRIALCGPRYHCASPMDLGTISVRCRNRFYSALK